MAAVHYDLIPSPLGTLAVVWTDAGISEICFDGEAQTGRLATAEALPAEHAQARAELAEYFAGKRRRFTLKLDLHSRSPFQQAVLTALADVEYGQTVCYGELAQAAGVPKAARAVGGALNRNPLPLVLACHRVVGANGALVGFAGGLERKQALLALESSS